MADGKNVHIRRISLNVPGRNSEAGHHIADGVAQGIGTAIPASLAGQIGGLHLRVPVGADATEAEVSQAITDAIGRSLRKVKNG